MVLTNPALRRHHGRLAIVKTKVDAEAKLDGKFLLSTTDPTIPATDLARLYKGLLESRPPGATSSRSSSCARSTTGSRTASVPTSACALALVVARVAEHACGQTWPRLRAELDRVHLGTFDGPAGAGGPAHRHHPAQRAIFQALKLTEPPVIIDADSSPARQRRSRSRTA
jgi:hypothetical protein